jgi:FAD-linked sulfhydryl oxidase
MSAFIKTLSVIYPCVYCAKDFEESVKKNPPNVSSREALSVWMCSLHNEVNAKLGKEEFSCSIEVLE